MAVDAHLYPGRQRIEGALTTHRAALPHRQLLMAAFDALGPLIRIGSEAAGAWPMAASGLAGLRRRCHRRWRGPGFCGPPDLLIPCRPVARHLAVTTRGGGNR